MTNLSRTAAAVLASLALSALAAPAANAQQTSIIRGTITTAESHAPISGAHVEIRLPHRVALTGDDGTYALRDVPDGTYRVYVTAIGRAADSSTVTVTGRLVATHD